MYKRKEFLVFGQPLIEEAEIEEVVATMRSGWLGTGPRTKRFEAEFAAYKNAPDAVAVSSATAGIHLACIAAGLKPGDEVITTPLTFCATANAVLHAGARPVLADIDPVTWNLDPAAVEHAITPRTRALLPVHFAGRPCNMEALTAIARRHNLLVIEDCAHAIESLDAGRPAGTRGDFGVFSFYSTKNVITVEGGMVLARDPEQRERVRRLSLHGMSKHAWQRFSNTGWRHYAVEEAGYKYNMTDMQAAIGIHHLARVERIWRRREALWARYLSALAGMPFTLPAPVSPGTKHAYHLFTLLVNDDAPFTRDDLLAAMTERNIGVGVHYLSLPEHPYYRQTLGWRPEAYPNAMRAGRRILSLPLTARMTETDVDDVILALEDAISHAHDNHKDHRRHAA